LHYYYASPFKLDSKRIITSAKEVVLPGVCLSVCLSVCNFTHNYQIFIKIFTTEASADKEKAIKLNSHIPMRIWIYELFERFFSTARWGHFSTLAHVSEKKN